VSLLQVPDVFMQFGLEQQFRFVSDDLSLTPLQA
jgi:hypothetical protein